MTPNIFAAYVTHGKSLDGGPAPKWQPVDMFKFRAENGGAIVLQQQKAIFEIGGDLQLKVVAHAAYDAATNTIYYYVERPVVEANAEWTDPAEWKLAHPGKDITLAMTDSNRLDWLEENRATVEFHPDGKPWQHWRVTIPGVSPRTGERLRDAISKAVSARERTLKQKEKRGQSLPDLPAQAGTGDGG